MARPARPWHHRPVTAEPLEFDCPRCSRPASASTYGPCEECRAELRTVMVKEGRDIEVGAYEPKMNVVPNQVASKE